MKRKYLYTFYVIRCVDFWIYLGIYNTNALHFGRQIEYYMKNNRLTTKHTKSMRWTLFLFLFLRLEDTTIGEQTWRRRQYVWLFICSFIFFHETKQSKTTKRKSFKAIYSIQFNSIQLRCVWDFRTIAFENEIEGHFLFWFGNNFSVGMTFHWHH